MEPTPTASRAEASPSAGARVANRPRTRFLNLGARGPTPEIVTIAGVNGRSASLTAKYTLATALNYCAAMAVYEGRDDEQTELRACAERELQTEPELHVVRADCSAARITAPWGPTYRHAGQELYTGYVMWDHWVDEASGELLVANRDVVSEHFKLLCPRALAALRAGASSVRAD